MSLNLINLVWNDRQKLKLSPVETATLVKLAALTETIKNPVFVSIKTISQSIGYCDRTVRRSLQSLITKQLIIKVDDKLPRSAFQWPNSIKHNAYKINVQAFSSKAKGGGR